MGAEIKQMNADNDYRKENGTYHQVGTAAAAGLMGAAATQYFVGGPKEPAQGGTGGQHQPSVHVQASEDSQDGPHQGAGGRTDLPTGPGPQTGPGAQSTTTEGQSATKPNKDGEGGLHWAVWAAIAVAALALVGAVIYFVAFSGDSAKADDV